MIFVGNKVSKVKQNNEMMCSVCTVCQMERIVQDITFYQRFYTILYTLLSIYLL